MNSNRAKFNFNSFGKFIVMCGRKKGDFFTLLPTTEYPPKMFKTSELQN